MQWVHVIRVRGSYWVLFLARVVSGFAGGNISAAQAYIADITTPAERSRGMGIIGAAFGIGFSLGPAIGGFAAHYGGATAPGLVAVALSLANFVSAYFILPESLGHEHRVKRPLFDLGHLGDAIARPRLRPLLIVWALVPFAFAGYTVALPLHAGTALGWKERELGILFTIIGITAATVQGYLFGKIVRRTPSVRCARVLRMRSPFLSSRFCIPRARYTRGPSCWHSRTASLPRPRRGSCPSMPIPRSRAPSSVPRRRSAPLGARRVPPQSARSMTR